MFSRMVAIERFFFDRVQRYAGGLAVYEAIEDAIYILPDAAGASAAGRDVAFIRAEMAANVFTADLFVIKSFFHLKKVLSSFMNCPTSLNCL